MNDEKDAIIDAVVDVSTKMIDGCAWQLLRCRGSSC